MRILILILFAIVFIVSCAPEPEEPAPFVPLQPKVAADTQISCSNDADCGTSFCSENQQVTPYCSFEGDSNEGTCQELNTDCLQGCEQGICKGNECYIVPGQPAQGCEAQHCYDNAVVAPFCNVSEGRSEIIDGVRAQVGFCSQRELQFCPSQEICTEGFCKGLPCQSDLDCGPDYCDRGQVIRNICQFRDPATGVLMQQGFCSHKTPLDCQRGRECRSGACKIIT